jgi:putative DNA methylase
MLKSMLLKLAATATTLNWEVPANWQIANAVSGGHLMTNGERVTHGDLPHWYKPGYAHFVTYRLSGSIPLSLSRRWREEREAAVRAGPSEGMFVAEHLHRVHKRHFSKYDGYLDHHPRKRWLADESIASIIRENLYYHHGDKYELLAFCIMPNHVHVLLQPFEFGSEKSSLPDRGGSCQLPRQQKTQSADRQIDNRPLFGIERLDAEAGSFSHDDERPPYSDEISDSRSPLSSIMHSLKSYTANCANQILGRTGRFWQHESYDHWVRDLDELERIVDYIRANPVRAGLCKTPAEWAWSSSADRFLIDGSDCGLVGWLRDDWQRRS